VLAACRRLVSFPEFLLVGDGRPSPAIRPERFRRNEYDRAIWRVVALLSPPLLAAEFGWSTAFLVAAGLGVVGSLAWLFVNPGAHTAWEVRVKDLKHESKNTICRSSCAHFSPVWVMAQPSGDPLIEGFRMVEVSSVADATEAVVRAALVYVARHAAAVQDKFAGPAVTVLMKKEEHKEGSAAVPGNAGRHRRRSGGLGLRHGA